MRHYPTIALALLVWITVIVARTNATNQLDFERVFAIALVAVSWFTIGVCVTKIRREREDR